MISKVTSNPNHDLHCLFDSKIAIIFVIILLCSTYIFPLAFLEIWQANGPTWRMDSWKGDPHGWNFKVWTVEEKGQAIGAVESRNQEQEKQGISLLLQISKHIYLNRKLLGILHKTFCQSIPQNLALLDATDKWTSHSRHWFYLSFLLPGFSHLFPLTLTNLVHNTAVLMRSWYGGCFQTHSMKSPFWQPNYDENNDDLGIRVSLYQLVTKTQ